MVHSRDTGQRVANTGTRLPGGARDDCCTIVEYPTGVERTLIGGAASPTAVNGSGGTAPPGARYWSDRNSSNNTISSNISSRKQQFQVPGPVMPMMPAVPVQVLLTLAAAEAKVPSGPELWVGKPDV